MKESRIGIKERYTFNNNSGKEEHIKGRFHSSLHVFPSNIFMWRVYFFFKTFVLLFYVIVVACCCLIFLPSTGQYVGIMGDNTQEKDILAI